MILDDTMRVLRYKNDVFFPEKNDYGDDYSIHDAVNEACVDLGLSDDDYSPGMNIKGYEVNIYLQ
jgi:hypothetical protein